MGCNGSRCWSLTCWDQPKKTVTEEHGEDEAEEFLKEMKEVECVLSADGCCVVPPPVSGAVLDLAHRMSEDIVAQALQLCWDVELRYKELPFIDSDCDYVI